jgi:hypothetical protein
LDFSWCAIAVQLAIYAHADTIYDPATKTHEAMPPVDQDKALVIHLPAGKATCTLYEVDIAAGWEAAQHALWTRNWRKLQGRTVLAVPATQIGGGEPAPVHAPTVEQAPPANTSVGVSLLPYAPTVGRLTPATPSVASQSSSTTSSACPTSNVTSWHGGGRWACRRSSSPTLTPTSSSTPSPP